ncbi:PIN domain-containing protein [Deinococcus metallilatus]|uniref:Ribonuclease VapC n=1 Tax=Deinococcus metallilatus TaxID=1211322 RepID=A0AAJ5F1U3_9DEIO|nr:TA system VapC family ribonuclease toxin [Deinococcus metallilatus]MBB5296448.1 hypothetical protein [Deinococcus metallilatus]QBY09883.1 PIN domain-containing protein [Deinococcus metallilatus]RXJ08607.1 PIN domain-containing protein [Deinococcus metallilatus]TLK25081.1 type II toxin-antitoxin system VapC family toxin [Deinococcus metallilatus]GMA14639.1 hypothetical protein GCM10025871_09700 [Deinococcus metallilatus]
MSFLLDTNTLIYAFQEEAPAHAVTLLWLKNTLASGERVYTCELNEVALVRITSLPSLGPRAAPPEEAFQFLRSLHALPNVGQVDLGLSGFARWRQLTGDLNLSGNDINDAYLTALALTHDLTLVTADRGFTRFAGLRVLPPE